MVFNKFIVISNNFHSHFILAMKTLDRNLAFTKTIFFANSSLYRKRTLVFFFYSSFKVDIQYHDVIVMSIYKSRS